MLLLDTQIVLWLGQTPENISATALTELRAAKRRGESLRISAFTLWEIAMLDAKNKISLESSIELFLQRTAELYDVVPLDHWIAIRSQRFSPEYPKDPADRVIGATALVLGMTLVTSDGPIRASGEVPCLW